MSVPVKQLFEDFASAMHEGDVGLFIGAGLSKRAGLDDWKELLRDFAVELGLNIDQEEHDLPSLAQYFLNRRRRNRYTLNQALIDKFTKPVEPTTSHEIIARLPLSTIWTTNYDKLMERALEKAAKRYQFKVRDEDLVRRVKAREVVLYKMHGDIDRPNEIIVSQENYERYAKTHPILMSTLEADLLTKTFLFLGSSFRDPNVNYILGHLPPFSRGDRRTHYAVMRRVRMSWHKEKEAALLKYEYEHTKQSLRIENLSEHSIETVFLRKYDDVPDLLREVERRYRQTNIYICGSAHEAGDFGLLKLDELTKRLCQRLTNRKHKLFCDFGSNLGLTILNYALPAVRLEADSYLLRPLPTEKLESRTLSAFNEACEDSMISRCGFVIYIAGSGDYYDPQVMNVYSRASQRTPRPVPIPIGASGFAAQKIWEAIKPTLKSAYKRETSKEAFYKLNDINLEVAELVDAVITIIESESSWEPEPFKQYSASEDMRREEKLRNVYDEEKEKGHHQSEGELRHFVSNFW